MVVADRRSPADLEAVIGRRAARPRHLWRRRRRYQPRPPRYASGASSGNHLPARSVPNPDSVHSNRAASAAARFGERDDMSVVGLALHLRAARFHYRGQGLLLQTAQVGRLQRLLRGEHPGLLGGRAGGHDGEQCFLLQAADVAGQ
jgi:hypothetical protein